MNGITTIPIPEKKNLNKKIHTVLNETKQHGPPKNKIVYFALSQLLVGILRLFKVLIRTLGQGAHIGSNSDVIWSTFILYCIHNGCYFDHLCRFRMICHYCNVIWKIKTYSSTIHCSIRGHTWIINTMLTWSITEFGTTCLLGSFM